MSSSIILKAAGLQTSANRLDLVDGALAVAENILIKRDGIIEQRRGFKLFGNGLPSNSQRVQQLTVYRNRLLRQYSAGKLQADVIGTGVFEDYLGSVVETEAGSRIKFIESNGNLYFTTSEGIKKLSARNAEQVGSVGLEQSGAVKALDLDGKVKYVQNLQTGFLPQDSCVAYRVVWNKKDNNNNLLTGTPSQRAVIYNPLTPLIVRDYIRVLKTMDGLVNSDLLAGARDFVETLLLGIGTSASELRTNLIALCDKLDNNLYYASASGATPLVIQSATINTGICTIEFTGSSQPATDYFVAGSKIKLEGFTADNPPALETEVTITTVATDQITFNTVASGPITLLSPRIYSNVFRGIPSPDEPQIPATNQNLVDIQDYLDIIIFSLQELNSNIVVGSDSVLIDSLDITTTSTVELSFTIPEDIALDENYFYQIYRSGISQAVGGTVLDDISPNDELQLVYEDYPTPLELENLEISIEDITPEDFRGANLYTNASSGEGIVASNDQPPFAKDVNRYRNSIFFANTRTKHRLSLNLLGVQRMIEDYDLGIIPKVTLTNGETTNTYEFITGQQEIIEATCIADISGSLNGKYFKLPAKTGNNLLPYFETSSTVAPIVEGFTPVKVSIAEDSTAEEVAIKLTNAISPFIDDFIVSRTTDTVEFVNVQVGELEDAEDVDTGFTITITQQGRGEIIQAQQTEITTIAGNLYTNTATTADYFTLNTAFNKNRLLFWFKTPNAIEPNVVGFSNVEIPVSTIETAEEMAEKIQAVIPAALFEVSISSNIIIVTNIQFGSCDPVVGVVADSGFTVETIQEGALKVLLSPLVSPARAVDATARSLVRVINKNLGDSVYAFYLSGALDVPGKIFLEGRNLQNTNPFYVVANNDNTGSSFNPIISPETSITNIAVGTTSSVITTTDPHGLKNGDEVVITSTNSQPIVDGLHEITYINANSFSIPAFVAIAGNEGAISRKNVTLVSENEEKVNRVYYSKFQQPEAVPIVNFFDVGSQDKKILRIVPLRDSLFVFKEDGLFRISGETAPFQLELFDSSFVVLAPDSVAVCNNVIYAWTTQGIQALTEGGAFVISRAIDNIILKIQSANFVNFKKATWGIGYESDNSYMVYTVTNPDDEYATIAYRYDTITQTWTTYNKSNGCGVVNIADDKLYMGTTDNGFIEQERKAFDRTDYADREQIFTIGSNSILPNRILLPLVDNVKNGDVITQEQTLTVYNYNMLLEKLTIDMGIPDFDFVGTLAMKKADSPRNKLIALATQLDIMDLAFTDYLDAIQDKNGVIDTVISEDNKTIVTTTVDHNLQTGRIVRITGSDVTPNINNEYNITVLSSNSFSIPVPIQTPGTGGSWATVGEDFEDVRICHNILIDKLNLDSTVNFTNYRPITTTTLFEVIITNVDRNSRRVTLNNVLDILAGDIKVYSAIKSTFTYSPTTMGDPLMTKHLRESTIMFETRTLTGGEVAFATDVLPQFIPIEFNLDGNGIFGHNKNFGQGFFGGLSNSVPFRTYIPRQCMRCRYMVVRFTHNVAREDYRVLGITITGNQGYSIKGTR